MSVFGRGGRGAITTFSPVFLLQRNLDEFGVRGVALEILFEVAAGVVGNLFAGRRVEVIDQFGHFDVTVEAGLKTQHRMVDAAQPGRGNQNQRKMMIGNVVDGRVGVGQRNEQSSRSL